ncbi:hypothetical protein LZP69_14610 [Shewanella sp. AS1]|uniref:hypothetical protein n=1 Tax=Shewanella sp. AS1 TaxID=2907626 RepID=UPI001F17FC82|nr:hypothetical protein [Shewanella sp. AS1]MCE9680387.1 hypothetical protein [Shewanella sp. AS1]
MFIPSSMLEYYFNIFEQEMLHLTILLAGFILGYWFRGHHRFNLNRKKVNLALSEKTPPDITQNSFVQNRSLQGAGSKEFIPSKIDLNKISSLSKKELWILINREKSAMLRAKYSQAHPSNLHLYERNLALLNEYFSHAKALEYQNRSTAINSQKTIATESSNDEFKDRCIKNSRTVNKTRWEPVPKNELRYMRRFW